MDDFLTQWYNAPQTVSAVNERHDVKEASRILHQPVDRDILRYYRRRLISVLQTFGIDVDLFKNPSTGHFMIDEKYVEDLFINILRWCDVNETEYKAVRLKKFNEVPEQTLADFKTQIYDALVVIGCTQEKIGEQMLCYEKQTGCQKYYVPQLEWPEPILELERGCTFPLGSRDCAVLLF